MKKRCEVAMVDNNWQVSFYPGGGVPPEVLVFDEEREALLAVSTWCNAERKDGQGVDLTLQRRDSASKQ